MECGLPSLDARTESVQEELLHRRKPRLVGCSLPVAGSPTESAVALVSKLDRSVLPIQGPPGTGKTTLGGKMIAALIAEGKRVGVTAVSHKVIENLLWAVQSETAGSAPLAHRKSQLTEGAEGIYFYSEPKETSELLDSGYVVGATAFLCSTEENESTSTTCSSTKRDKCPSLWRWPQAKLPRM